MVTKAGLDPVRSLASLHFPHLSVPLLQHTADDPEVSLPTLFVRWPFRKILALNTHRQDNHESLLSCRP